MYLKRLEITGFKTFADRTVIDFSAGATALVGPNGCGKSNIVDAVRWVLGESSATSLRSEKMDDVIFAGSAKRKPLSMSEVSLTFSEFRRPGQAEAEEITIRRIIYRDGQNQYFIGDSRVNKSEISRLFMDTGIGKSSYSVMEQGKVDMILSSSPENRRYIFEEAAGISAYKLELKRTYKKLEATENNMQRLSDIIGELEREYKLKEKQAGRTRRYFKLEEELASHGMRILYARVLKLQKQQQSAGGDLKKLLDRRERILKRIEKEEKLREEKLRNREELRQKIHDLDKDTELKKAQLDSIHVQTEKGSHELQQIKAKRNDLENQLQKIRTTLKKIRGSMEKFRQLELDLTTNLESTRVSIDAEQKKKYDASEMTVKLEGEVETNNRLIEQKKEEEEQVREEIDVAIHELIREIEKIKKNMTEQKDERLTRASTLRRRLGELDAGIQSLAALFKKHALAAAKMPDVNAWADLHERLEEILANDDVAALSDEFSSYEQAEDGFRRLIFDKKGIHARKEELDGRLQAITGEQKSLAEKNRQLAEGIEQQKQLRHQAETSIASLEADMREYNTRKESISTSREDTLLQLKETEEQEKYFEESLNNYNRAYQETSERINRLHQNASDLEKLINTNHDRLHEWHENERNLSEKLDEERSTSRQDKEELDSLFPLISEAEKKVTGIQIGLDNLTQEIYNNYNLTLEEAAAELVDKKIDLEAENRDYQRIKSEMNGMGQINPLALEEYERVKQLYEHNCNQRDDVDRARKNLLELIKDIEQKSAVQFMDTFTEVQKNFEQIFSKLFEGGRGDVRLLEPDRPLESGIEVNVQPPGKKPKTLKMLSGGERAMTAVALLFSTFKVKSAPFCFLDEIDAPWDESNIGRFLNMLQEFMIKSQFIMVTHAKKTMAMADQILGVTMEEPGVSRLVGIELHRKNGNDNGNAGSPSGGENQPVLSS